MNRLCSYNKKKVVTDAKHTDTHTHTASGTFIKLHGRNCASTDSPVCLKLYLDIYRTENKVCAFFALVYMSTVLFWSLFLQRYKWDPKQPIQTRTGKRKKIV